MAEIRVTTSIPCLIVHLYDGYNTKVASRRGSQKPIPHFTHGDDIGVAITETITIRDLKKGVYTLRFLIPYYSIGCEFTMPIMMDEIVRLETDEKIVGYDFLARLTKI